MGEQLAEQATQAALKEGEIWREVMSNQDRIDTVNEQLNALEDALQGVVGPDSPKDKAGGEDVEALTKYGQQLAAHNRQLATIARRLGEIRGRLEI